jgi:hypothetical protein
MSTRIQHQHKTPGPEELVQRETKVLNVLRILLFVVLIVVGLCLSVGCYKLTSKWEEETYHNDFNVISTRFVELFQLAVTQFMWNANTIGVAISASSDVANLAPNITFPLFDKLTDGALQLTSLNHVFWSPLVNGEKERREWEAYAQLELNGTENTTESKCYVCGSPDSEIGALNVLVQLPVGTYSCGKLPAKHQNSKIVPIFLNTAFVA